jgi:putative transposase
VNNPSKQTHFHEEPVATRHGTNGEGATQAVSDDSDFLRAVLERTLQQVLDAEIMAHVGAEPQERSETGSGHRNGHKSRTPHMQVGTLTLMVPQDGEGTLSTTLVLALVEMHLEGVSTRKVTDSTVALCSTPFSKSLVSSLAGRLDEELTPAPLGLSHIFLPDPENAVFRSRHPVALRRGHTTG